MATQMVTALFSSPYALTVLAFLVAFTFLVSSRGSRSNAARKGELRLPPTPPGLPVVGHLHLLGSLPHRSLRALAATYGPVMHLRLGRVPTVVACSAAAAEEAMRTRDLDFASRPRLLMVDRFYYGTGGIGFAPYGEHWRQARRVCVTHMLNARRVASLGRVRAQEAAALVDRVRQHAGAVVNLSDNLIVYSNTVISRCTFGDTDYGVEGSGGARLRKVFAEIEELLGTVPMGETVPWLRWVDVVTGLERKTRRVFEEMDGLLERVLADHRQRRRANAATGEEGDFVDVMLDAEELDTGSIKGVILDMLAAATDSTFTLLEWAMAELINHPHEMRKLQDEVREAVGPGASAVVTEELLPRLPYLKAVVKEALRLHPPTPLLLPRETLEDTRLLGYDVPAGTRVLIHAWAIGRDPATWGSRAEEFAPERFLGYDLKMGQDFAFLPFGAGRRGCPGVGFAMMSNELALASLMGNFDWELPGGRMPPVDMSELHGLSVRLKVPLLLVARPWPPPVSSAVDGPL
ncbi:cytochrome P450 71A1-like [Hordeum vulgare subsp. vulgare]|uniref:cytochrome P450 71A1-like n=1 Tax=Hordeum vulgare subsp. vulgare TaxID=112509 RepID=UPI00162BAD30|nr:cytochrome P450 71A1-like [Hordeum vulgare subsp. vulgare]